MCISLPYLSDGIRLLAGKKHLFLEHGQIFLHRGLVEEFGDPQQGTHFCIPIDAIWDISFRPSYTVVGARSETVGTPAFIVIKSARGTFTVPRYAFRSQTEEAEIANFLAATTKHSVDFYFEVGD